jgi:hypothetical protein
MYALKHQKPVVAMGFFACSFWEYLYCKESKIMPKIKELLANEKEIWLYLTEGNYLDFFKQAKKEGFVWINGQEILDNENMRLCVAVYQDGSIAHVSCFARFGAPGKGAAKENEQYAHIRKLKF